MDYETAREEQRAEATGPIKTGDEIADIGGKATQVGGKCK